ncbi:hypothetical protein PAXRUDRAFT_763793, partial [Paxillus rubicundulus Ve08.2h10]
GVQQKGVRSDVLLELIGRPTGSSLNEVRGDPRVCHSCCSSSPHGVTRNGMRQQGMYALHEPRPGGHIPRSHQPQLQMVRECGIAACDVPLHDADSVIAQGCTFDQDGIAITKLVHFVTRQGELEDIDGEDQGVTHG